METIYYNLDARRLTEYDMASGEGAARARQRLYLRRQTQAPAGGGVVLNLADYRRSAGAAEEVSPAEEVLPQARAEHAKPPRGRRAALALEFCASAAVVIMAVVVVACFLPFF